MLYRLTPPPPDDALGPRLFRLLIRFFHLLRQDAWFGAQSVAYFRLREEIKLRLLEGQMKTVVEIKAHLYLWREGWRWSERRDLAEVRLVQWIHRKFHTDRIR